MKRKFLRTDTNRHSKLGKNRKKLQRWRKPRGRHNKIREKRFSYPVMPVVGMKKSKSDSGKINGKNVVIVRNLEDARNVDVKSYVIIAKVGAKKKIDMLKILNERKIEIAKQRSKKK